MAQPGIVETCGALHTTPDRGTGRTWRSAKYGSKSGSVHLGRSAKRRVKRAQGSVGKLAMLKEMMTSSVPLLPSTRASPLSMALPTVMPYSKEKTTFHHQFS